jgi:hypothetical protein
MTDDNVIQMFTHTPAADPENGGSEKVEAFVEDHLGDFMTAVNGMDHAADFEEFNSWKQQVQRLVKGWPKL